MREIELTSLFDLKLLVEGMVKFGLAGLLGALIGFEREAHGQSAGFRTYILVCMSCCLIMMLSLHMEEMYRHLSDESAVRLDPGRIASYAIAGMGFLGAGAIITGRGVVKGLTTAAGLWMITAVGLAVGAGYFLPAVLVTVFSLFALFVLRRTKSVFGRDVYRRLELACQYTKGLFEQIEERIENYLGTSIQAINVERDLDKNSVHFDVSLIWKEDFEWRELLRDLGEISAVRKVVMKQGEVP